MTTQMVTVYAMQFGCNICGNKYPTEDKAKRCFEVHSKAINRLLAGYKPGARIMAHYLGNNDYGEFPVTIVKTEGELTKFVVLVESVDGSRWWEKIVAYQLGNRSMPDAINNKPTNFFTSHPIVP